MSRAIRSMVRLAAMQYAADGIVSADLMMDLAAAGYELSALQGDIDTLLAQRAPALDQQNLGPTWPNRTPASP